MALVDEQRPGWHWEEGPTQESGLISVDHQPLVSQTTKEGAESKAKDSNGGLRKRMQLQIDNFKEELPPSTSAAASAIEADQAASKPDTRQGFIIVPGMFVFMAFRMGQKLVFLFVYKKSLI